MIIIGSYPIKNILGREPKDLDLLATLEDFREFIGPLHKITVTDSNHAYTKKDGVIYDCELIWPNSLSEELHDKILTWGDYSDDVMTGMKMADLNVLYMLKMSHRFKKNSPHFHKTRSDIARMRAAGARIMPEYQDFYERRMAETYSYSHPKLKASKSEFFRPEDSFYLYDHDSIHEAVAIDGAPAYTKYAVDGEQVLSSRKKFFAASPAVRLAGVYEETCVLALERSQIPRRFKVDPEWSFMKSLEKVCTSITSGWFRTYSYENYDAVVQLYREMGPDDYIWRLLKNKLMLRPYERK